MTDQTLIRRTPLAYDEALAFAAQAEAASETIHELHRDPYAGKHRIAEQHQRQGLAIKLAEIHALLAIAEQVRELRADLAAS